MYKFLSIIRYKMIVFDTKLKQFHIYEQINGFIPRSVTIPYI